MLLPTLPPGKNSFQVHVVPTCMCQTKVYRRRLRALFPTTKGPLALQCAAIFVEGHDDDDTSSGFFGRGQRGRWLRDDISEKNEYSNPIYSRLLADFFRESHSGRRRWGRGRDIFSVPALSQPSLGSDFQNFQFHLLFWKQWEAIWTKKTKLTN